MPIYHSHTFDGIGVSNQVVVTDPHALDEAALIARREVAALDLACSRFRDDSELTVLNRSAGRRCHVGPLLLEAVETALFAAAWTEGLVDPTVGRSMRAIGYDRSFELVVVPGSTPSFALVAAGGWERVVVDHEERLITVPRGVELDLGATAKALAADRIAAAVRHATGSDVLVSLGGDVSVQGSPPDAWPIHVTDSHRVPGAPGQTIALRAGGLATSSTTVRRWSAGGVELHHVVDPVTGAPALGPWRTVTVAAETCVTANTAATAAIVLGEVATEWLSGYEFDSRLIDAEGAATVTGGWPVHS